MIDWINSVCNSIAISHAKRLKNQVISEGVSIHIDTPIYGAAEKIRKTILWPIVFYGFLVTGLFLTLLYDRWPNLLDVFKEPKYFFSDFPQILLLISVVYWFFFLLYFFSGLKSDITISFKNSSAEYIKQCSLNHSQFVAMEKQRILEETQAKLAAEEAARKIKQAEDEAYRKRLQEIEDVEAAKSRGQAKGLAELYRHQIELLVEYKKRGADIDKEVFDMREKLLVMERQENNFMIQDLLKTLDSI